MKKYIYIIAATLVSVLAASCNKESVNQEGDSLETPITITAQYGNLDTKVAYTESGSDITATWQTGDIIYVVFNGKVNTLTLTSGAGNVTATFSGSLSGSPKPSSILACYVKDVNNASALTVSGDALVYSDAAFLSQDGTLASAAKCNVYSGTTTYGDGTNISCTFGVSTSICKFTFSNIGADKDAAATLVYNSKGVALARASFTVANAGDNLIYLAVPAGHFSGEQALEYKCGANMKHGILSASQANFTAGQTYSLTMALLDGPEGGIGGKFSVSATKQVYFSKGNLQYTRTSTAEDWNTGTWSFMDHQGNFILDETPSQADYADKTVVSLFGWGTSGVNPAYPPYYTDNGGDYGNVEGEDNAGTDRDWGVYNTIDNGGSGWHTLTAAEWEYLLKSRTGGTVNGTPNPRYAYAMINNGSRNVKGLILFPDNCTLGDVSGVTWSTLNGTTGSWSTRTECTAAGWTALEAEGCVFLPAAGNRTGQNVSGSDYNAETPWGQYWTGSYKDKNDYGLRAKKMLFSAGYDAYFGESRVPVGCSVRLVKDVQ